MLGKIIFNDIMFTSSAQTSFILLVQRFSDEFQMQDYISAFIQICMKFLLDFEAQRAALAKTHKFAESMVKQKTNRSVI